MGIKLDKLESTRCSITGAFDMTDCADIPFNGCEAMIYSYLKGGRQVITSSSGQRFIRSTDFKSEWGGWTEADNTIYIT